MSTITLPNRRVGSDLTVRLKLKDGGLAIDWSTLSRIKAFLYSDAQRALAGRCDVSVDGDDPTILVCRYASTKMQYLGVNRIIVQCSYLGETKTYDKPALNFVRWTEDQEGEELTIDDPDIDVEIDVEDVTSSILQNILDACIKATEEAQEVVDASRGPRGYSAYEIAVQDGFEGTEEEWLESLVGPAGESAYQLAVDQGYEGTLPEWLASLHGADGDSAYQIAVEEGFVGTKDQWLASLVGPQGLSAYQVAVVNGYQGTVSEWLASLVGPVGPTPAFSIGTVSTGAAGSAAAASISGTAAAPVLNLVIPKGDQGNTGSSVDYPYELVNNRTTNDATKGLSAAEGYRLGQDLSQLEAKVTELDDAVDEIAPQIPYYKKTEQAGFLTSAGTYSNPNSNYHSISSEKLSCSPGDKFVYKGYATGNAVSAVFYNGNTVVGSYATDARVIPEDITIPSGCDGVVFSSYNTLANPIIFGLVGSSSLLYRMDVSERKTDELETISEESKESIIKLIDTNTIFTIGYFININGVISDSPAFAMSGEIPLAKGQTITASLKGYSSSYFSAVAVKNTNGTYTKKVTSSNADTWGLVTYMATEDCIVVLSTNSDSGDITNAKAYIFVNGKELQNNLIDLQSQISAMSNKFGLYVNHIIPVNFNDGHYVDSGGVYRANNDFSVSDIIFVTKSQVLSFTAKGAGTVVALLARVNDDGSYTPIVNSINATPKAVVYQSDRNQRLVISTNKSFTVTVQSYYNDETFQLLVDNAVGVEPVISSRQKRLYSEKFGNGNFDAELNMFICYGQSWAEGYDAHAVSLVRRYDNIMLNTGVKNNPLEDTSVTATSFSPMVEADGVDTPQLCGETPVSSQCNMVKQLIEDEDGYLYTDFPYQMIGIAPGYGSQSLAQLSKGTTWYTRLLAMVSAANSIAEGLGKRLVVQAFSWAQNAKGALSGTYAENLEQLREDIDADVKAITGQTQTVKCITWQTFLYEANGAADCYAKYVGASEVYPNIICAGASYQFPHISANNLHLTSIGQLWTGSMFGVAYKRTIIDGEKFVPLKPISANFSGKELYIKFNVPQKPLKIDTSMVSEATNYGFNIVNGGVEKDIVSVTIINPDTVRIICDENIESSDHITYSQNAGTLFGPVSGNRGNLRDSQGDYIRYVAENGAVLRIDNWCVVFDKTVEDLQN